MILIIMMTLVFTYLYIFTNKMLIKKYIYIYMNIYIVEFLFLNDDH